MFYILAVYDNKEAYVLDICDNWSDAKKVVDNYDKLLRLIYDNYNKVRNFEINIACNTDEVYK